MAKGLGKLHFWGERDKPMTPSELAAKMPVAGTGKTPEQLLKLRNHSLHVVTSGKTKPTIKMEEVERRNGETVWRIEIPHWKEQGAVPPTVELC